MGRFGVSNTDIENNPLYGTLKSISGSDLLARQAIEGAQALAPAPREISGAELALQFFSNMAANASQPGSTALSSAASAIKPTADEYIRQVEANRKAQEATGPLAISLAKALKPDKVTPRAPVKVMVGGKAVYMSAAKAIREGYEVATTPSSTGTYKSVLVDRNDDKGPVLDFMNSNEITAAKAAGFTVTNDKTTKSSTTRMDVLLRDGVDDPKTPLINERITSILASDFDEKLHIPASALDTTAPKTPVAPKTYQVPPDNIEAFKLKFPLVAIDPDGIVLLNSKQFVDAQNLVFSYNKPAGGTEKERGIETLNRIAGGWNYEDSSWNEGVSPEDKTEYGIQYQMLMKGYETTRIVDGREQTIKVPGIDLTITNLPVPEGFDPSTILNDRARDFGPQAVDAGFAQRMLYAEGLVRDVLVGGYEPNVTDAATDDIGTWIGSSLQSPQGQRFYQASRNFIAAVLRKESGAAISDGEYTNGLKQYFPRVGDGPEVLKQKEALRESAIKGMVNVSGDAFAYIFPEAVPFLSFEVNNEKIDILNPRGYSSNELAKSLRGKGLFFDYSLGNMGVDELRGMLGKPEGTYTPDQLNKIAARLDELGS